MTASAERFERVFSQLRVQNPTLLKLAQAVSLAVVVEPRLLRSARLQFVPFADAGTEADLWFSPIVESSTPLGFTLAAEAARLLWNGLVADQDLLEQIWHMTALMHADSAPAIKLTEELTWLGLSTRVSARYTRIDQRLQEVLVALVRDDRQRLARWALHTLPRLPHETSKAPSFQRVAWAAMARMPDAPPIVSEITAQGFHTWVPAVMPKQTDAIEVVINRSATELVFRIGSSRGSYRVLLPRMQPMLISLVEIGGRDTEPRMISLRVPWARSDRRDAVGGVGLRPGETRVSVGRAPVRIRTASGAVYEVPAFRPQNRTPPGPLAFALAPDDVDPMRLGAVRYQHGVNCSVFSPEAEKVELCLFAQQREIARLAMAPGNDGMWQGYLPQAGEDFLYGYRVYGRYEPERGLRFNANKLLIDPYAKQLFGRIVWSDAHYGYRAGSARADLSFDRRDNARGVPKCRVIETGAAADRRHVLIPWERTVLYQLHIKGLTQLHQDVPPPDRGCYLGVASPPIVDHLKSLGVTSVILSPVQEFLDPRHLVERGLRDYWGYNPIAFFTPTARYATDDPIQDFRDMVALLHEAGFEVLMLAVYAHTGEANQMGPTLSFRGIANSTYYRLLPDNPRYCDDITGSGNALNMANPATRQLVLDSMRYWISDMGVDGFVMLSAVTLGRSARTFSSTAQFFEDIRRDPVLSQAKLIAEPWDVGAGGYQVGNFPPGWSEWNLEYRNAVRAFWRGDPHVVPRLAQALTGSRERYQQSGRNAAASVNYLCSNDGFTLADLVSYSEKHNEANGEDNRDGEQDNLSWNCGVEGPSEDPEVLQLRAWQKRNLLATLFLSRGVPMLLMGDELSRSQGGNNNAYCQDNEISWMNWEAGRVADPALPGFVRELVMLRKSFAALHSLDFLSGNIVGSRRLKDIYWLSPDGHEMSGQDWQDDRLRTVGMQLGNDGGSSGRVLILFNAAREPIKFRLPSTIGGPWLRVFDTHVPDGVVREPDLSRDHAALLQPGGVLILPELCVVVFRDVAPDETAAVA